MALTGTDAAYLQARAGIGRSGAIRSNYVFPLTGTITADGVDVSRHIQHGSLRVTLALNEQPDTASFDVLLTDGTVDASTWVGSNVRIAIGSDTLFGGRILTTQTTKRHASVPSLRSVMCADYLQVLDAEYLITYDWPTQSATITIVDLIARFANKTAGIAISTAAVAVNLPSHPRIGVINEKFSTVLRKLVTAFPGGGGFYVDPFQVLHVWEGASEPGAQNPAPLTLANPTLKQFAETIDASQIRDACLVEGMRTKAPLGTPDASPFPADGRHVDSFPVLDASILPDADGGIPREVRVNDQRYFFHIADGPWKAPDGTPQTAVARLDVPFDPTAPGHVIVEVDSIALVTGRTYPWVKVDNQLLFVFAYTNNPTPRLEVLRTGFGAMIGPIAAGAVITSHDSLAVGYVTGRYDAPGRPELVRPQAIDADVVITTRATTGPAIHEQLVQDGRYTRQGAMNRGARELQDFDQALRSIQFETDDLNAKPGRLQAYAITNPPGSPMSGEVMIITADLTWPVWGLPPRRSCYAAEVHPASVTDAWLVDPR